MGVSVPRLTPLVADSGAADLFAGRPKVVQVLPDDRLVREIEHEVEPRWLAEAAHVPTPAREPVAHREDVEVVGAIGQNAQWRFPPDLESERTYAILESAAGCEDAPGPLAVAVAAEEFHDRPGGRNGAAGARSREGLGVIAPARPILEGVCLPAEGLRIPVEHRRCALGREAVFVKVGAHRRHARDGKV